MPRAVVDMVGQRFASLAVVARAEDHVGTSGARHVQWLCRCECGDQTVKRGTALRNGSAKSCGCARSSSMLGKGLADLTGRRFGRWTVIDRAENGANRQTFWNCVCDCGARQAVNAKSLKNGDSRSCGCFKADRLGVDRDLVGASFGRWTVLAPVSTSRPRTWSCRCSCGAEREVVETSLVTGKSISCGCYRTERATAAWNMKADDLTGRHFGRWTALHRFDVQRYDGGGQTIRWWCRCECGVERAVLVGALRDGTSQSCGCATGSRMESFVRRFCLEHGLAFMPQRGFPELRGSGGRVLAFDFEIMTPSGPVLVECQGEQHFRAVEWFGGQERFVEQQRNDAAKREHVLALRLPLIEIDYRVNTYEAMAEALGTLLAQYWPSDAVLPWEDNHVAR